MSLHAARPFSGGDAGVSSVTEMSPPPAQRVCTACGYDLRGLEICRCPECGLQFDPDFFPIADIPWLKRGDAAVNANATGGNAFVAYWRTVWLVLVRPRRFGQIVWQDVEVDAAATMRFRWVTIGITVGSLLAAMLPLLGAATPAAIVAVAMLAPPLIAFFAMATSPFNLIPFVSWRYLDEMRYRRLHDLTCAGLALSPIVPMSLLLGVMLDWPLRFVAPRAVALCGVVLIAWWYGSLRYQIHGGRCRSGDAIVHALVLPFAWLMIAIVILIFGLGISGIVLGLLK